MTTDRGLTKKIQNEKSKMFLIFSMIKKIKLSFLIPVNDRGHKYLALEINSS
jgi:hypothetical protein